MPICLLFGGLTAGIYFYSEEHRVDIGLLMIAAFFLMMLVISITDIYRKNEA